MLNSPFSYLSLLRFERLVSLLASTMPAIRKIVPPCGREYWDSLDHENLKQVLEAVKEEVNCKGTLIYITNSFNLSNSSTDQSRRISFIIAGVGQAIDLFRRSISESTWHVSATARYSCSAVHSSWRAKDGS
jgi:hypothetical protein